MSRAFLFDIGNVLLHFDFNAAARRFASQSSAGADEVLALLEPFKSDLESGRISDADFITQGMARIGFRGTRGEFSEIWSDIFTENQPMGALVRRLAKQGHPLYLFSNTSGLHKDWFTRRFDVFAQFRGGVFSHEAGCVKPDAAFYELAIERFGLEPSQTIYIDDLPENIATGRRLGFVCHHYSPAEHDTFVAAAQAWLTGR